MQILHVQSLIFFFQINCSIHLKTQVCIGRFPEKGQAGGGEVGSWNPGGIKKKHVEIPGLYYKRNGISSSDQEKIMWNWNFRLSCFSALEFPRGATQLCGILDGFFLEYHI